jgi:multidrug efflux pump subunit AcrA (membrane-fusion protein)
VKRLVLPLIGLLSAAWAAASVTRTHPLRNATDPPARPPVSTFLDTIAAVGLVEPSTENISIGSPLGGVVARVFVVPGARVKAGDPLFELDIRHLKADVGVRRQELVVARARIAVAEARRKDVERHLEFVQKLEPRAISAEEVSRRQSAVEVGAAEVDAARAEAAAAESRIAAIETEIERSSVRAPIDAEVLQVRLRVGEYAPAASTEAPMIILGESRPLHVRVDVDEHEASRVGQGAAAVGHVRGNADLVARLRFVRFEPFVVPKRSLTGDSTERVDTRVLQVIYRVEGDDVRLFVGQQLDVFIDGGGGDKR